MIKPESFKRSVRQWAETCGVEVREIHIRKMKTKWASCSSRGRLTFDRALLRQSKNERTRIIVHELLHLKYPNHGKMFKALLKAYTGSKE
ncbi:MAG: M48 family metallopeptidase [Methanomicrobiales archaeon]|nr:M48 family metallopeptidase [Methanomicrobiales archaeon]